MKASILLVEDEEKLARFVELELMHEGYQVEKSANGREALEAVENNDIHLVLLDIMMPVMDGISALSEIRKVSNAPVILLTAKSEDNDKILGLNVGADDYITKPFNPLEVTARVRSQLRRYLKLGGGVAEQESYTIGGIELNDRNKEVFLDGEPVQVTPKEYDILKLLMANPGRVFSPKEIYSTVWKEKPFGTDNTVAVHIRHLREKLEIDPSEPRYIKVIFGQGYKIEKGR